MANPVDDGAPHDGACHCGAVRFRVTLDHGFAGAGRCTCSICAMRGAVSVTAPLENFELLSGADALKLYQFGTRTAEHYFCGECGIYTHHRQRSDPDRYAVNIACLAGLSPFDFDSVEVRDNVVHSKDSPEGGQVIGRLVFVRE